MIIEDDINDAFYFYIYKEVINQRKTHHKKTN